MKNSDKYSPARLWTSVILDGGLAASIKIVRGRATLRVFGLDAPVPGVFETDDIEGVLAAYRQQLEESEAKYLALQSESVQEECCDDNYGLIPVSDGELAEQIRQFEKQCKIISLKTKLRENV